jgi:hypothetical protein
LPIFNYTGEDFFPTANTPIQKNMIKKLFLKCYTSIDFIPDSNIDRKIAKAALLTSLFVLGTLSMLYELFCFYFSFSFNKPIAIVLIILSIFGTQFYFVTKSRGRKLLKTEKAKIGKRILTLSVISITGFGLFFLNLYLIDLIVDFN